MSTATATSMKLTAEQESENARINAENERLRKQARAKRTISLTRSYVALALVTFLMIFPLIIVVIVSFTPNAVTQTWPPKIIPSAWTLDNYTSLFQRLPIGRELLNTSSEFYGGSGEGNGGGLMAQDVPWDGYSHSLELTLPAMSTTVFKWRKDE